MHTHPKLNDFVRDKHGLVRGFVVGDGVIPCGGENIPAHRVKTPHTVELIPKDSVEVINRDGFEWKDWLRLYRQGRVKL